MNEKWTWRQFQYYGSIGILSLIVLVFLPMVGTEIGLEWRLPNTGPGWIVYVMSKLLVAAINIMIFHCFIKQGKLNVEDSKLYKEANEILMISSTQDPEILPQAPDVMIHKLYRSKGITVFFTSLLATIGLTQAVLTYDLLTMGTYLVTILIGIISGIFTMNDVETIWTVEYWKYSQMIKKQLAIKEPEPSNQSQPEIDPLAPEALPVIN